MRSKVIIIYTVIALSIFLHAPTLTARTWTILSDGTGDAPTIQAGIDSATTGDIVELVDGTFQGPGNRDIDFLGKAITVRSASGNPDDCRIDCEGSETESHRGFTFHNAEAGDSILDGVTVMNGYTEGLGAGINCAHASPTIRNCVLRDNSGCAWEGGAGLGINGGNPRVENCLFQENHTDTALLCIVGNGGGVLCTESAAPTFTDCEFVGNSVSNTFDCCGNGGGMASFDSSPILTRCTFTNNTTPMGGMCSGSGAGFCAFGGSPWLEECIFDSNSADGAGAGGALSILDGCELQMINCTLYGNTSFYGIVFCHGNATLTAENTIMAFNVCNPDWGCDGGSITGGGTISFVCCDIYGNEHGDWVGDIADQYGTNGNFSENPRFCDAELGNFTLSEISPCAPGNNPECGLIGALGIGCIPILGLDDDQPSMAFRLEPAFPNPFNPATTIRFSLRDAQNVRLNVYAADGKLVTTLIHRRLSAGPHAVVWHGRDEHGRLVASGVYVYRLDTGSHRESRRMVLIR